MMSQGGGSSKVHTFQLKVGTYSRDVTQPGGGGTLLGVTHKCDVRDIVTCAVILGREGRRW